MPKLPGYGNPQGPSSEPLTPGGKLTAPPKAPMVNKGLLNKIRSTPRTPEEQEPAAPADQPQEPQPAIPSSCGDCFRIFVEDVTPNHEITARARGEHFPWERQYEKAAFHKALQYCAEKFTDGKCSWARDCEKEREVTSEGVEDIYPDDGTARTPGVKSKIGIYFRCIPKPPKSPIAPPGPLMEQGKVSFNPSVSGSSEGKGSVFINIEKESDTSTPDGTIPPQPPTGESLQAPGPSAPSGTQEKSGETTPANGVPQTPAGISSEKPSGCRECFKVVVEMPFSQSPFNDFESQWQEEAFNKAKGICQEACSDKRCTDSIPCGEKPVERQEISPENLSFDPTSGRVNEGMKTRIEIYYKCIPPIGEESKGSPQVTVAPLDAPKIPVETPAAPPKVPEVPMETPQTPMETPTVPAEAPKTPPETPKAPEGSTSTTEDSGKLKVPAKPPKAPIEIHKTPYSRLGTVKGSPFVSEDGKLTEPEPIPKPQVIESQEDCCKRAEAKVLRCYSVESVAFFNQCVEERIGGAGGGYIDAMSGWSDAVDAVCETEKIEFQTQCLEIFLGKCNPRCKVPVSIRISIERGLIEILHGRGSTAGGGGNTRFDPKVITDNEPH